MTNARFESFGGPVPGIGGLVALLRDRVSPDRKLVALAGRLVALGAGVVAHFGDVVPLVAVDIALIAGLVALARSGVHAHNASPRLAVGSFERDGPSFGGTIRVCLDIYRRAERST